MRCRERLHELVREEFEADADWEKSMARSFTRMDMEVVALNADGAAKCRCELQRPDCDAVGSTAVVSVLTPEKIIVANCGDSRAVLCRNGKAIALSSDHKVFCSFSDNLSSFVYSSLNFYPLDLRLWFTHCNGNENFVTCRIRNLPIDIV